MTTQLTLDDLLNEIEGEKLGVIESGVTFTPVILKYEVCIIERVTLVYKARFTGQVKKIVCYRHSYYPIGRSRCRDYYAERANGTTEEPVLTAMIQADVQRCTASPIVKYQIVPTEGERS